MPIGAIDANEIRIAPNGHVYVASANTAAPTDLSTALSSSWTDLGYCTEDGVTLAYGVDLNDINAWQSAVPVKRGLSGVSLEISFTLMQTNKEVLELYFGDASWANGASGVATMTVPSNPIIADMEHAIVIEYTDDNDDNYRLYCGRGIVSDREEIALKREDAVMYGVTYVAFDNNGELARLLSDSLDLYSS